MIIALEKTVFAVLLLGMLTLTLAACVRGRIDDTNGYYSSGTPAPVKCKWVTKYRQECKSI